MQHNRPASGLLRVVWQQRDGCARQAYADRNPQSRLMYEAARRVLPGGHTRTVLSHPPFPLTFVRGPR